MRFNSRLIFQRFFSYESYRHLSKHYLASNYRIFQNNKRFSSGPSPSENKVTIKYPSDEEKFKQQLAQWKQNATKENILFIFSNISQKWKIYEIKSFEKTLDAHSPFQAVLQDITLENIEKEQNDKVKQQSLQKLLSKNPIHLKKASLIAYMVKNDLWIWLLKAALAGLAGFMIDQSIKRRAEKLETLNRIRNYVDEQWATNVHFLDNLDIIKTPPRLYLYTHIDLQAISLLHHIDKELNEKLEQNLRLKNRIQEVKTSIFKPGWKLKRRWMGPVLSLIKIIEEDLQMQFFQLSIAQALNKSVLRQREKQYQKALKEIQLGISLLKAYKSYQANFTLINEVEVSLPINRYLRTDELLVAAYNTEAKVYRSLAGLNYDQLDILKLQASEASYLKALEISHSDPIILNSLGYLYGDMGKIKEALAAHQRAHKLKPNDPMILCGMGRIYYYQEKNKLEQKLPMDDQNLTLAHYYFNLAYQLTILQKHHQLTGTDANLLCERGRLLKLMGKTKDALQDFNEGLAIDPNHPLLLIERGQLYLKLKYYSDAIKDFEKTKIIVLDDSGLIDKCDAGIQTAKTAFHKNPFLKVYFYGRFFSKASSRDSVSPPAVYLLTTQKHP